MITDDEMRDALHRVVAVAPDGVRVRSALAHRSRLRRQRRALLVAGGVTAAAAAVAAPITLMSISRQRPEEIVVIEAGLPNLDAPPAPPPPSGGNTFVPLRWRPTWLPEGYVEVSRAVNLADPAGGVQRRSWWLPGTRPEDGATTFLYASPSDGFLDQSWRRPATVNGAPGGISHHPNQISQIVWSPTPDEILEVGLTSGAPDTIEIAQRIAGSVVADGVAGCESPLALGWLPSGVDGQQVITVDTDDFGDPRYELRLQPAEDPNAAFPLVTVLLGTTVHRPGGGEPVTVHGQPGFGRVVPGGEPLPSDASVPVTGPRGWVHVALDDGRQLQVSVQLHHLADPPELTLADVIRTTEDLHIGPDPDLSWLGHR